MVALAIRRRALRLWVKGAPRKMIAELCEVCEGTIKDWRYRYQWPSRKAYALRPQTVKWKHEKPQRKAIVTRACSFACPRCSFRASDPQGHPLCREVA